MQTTTEISAEIEAAARLADRREARREAAIKAKADELAERGNPTPLLGALMADVFG